MAFLFALRAAVALLAGVACAHAEPLPNDERERNCWLQHTRERTRVKLTEPTAVDVSNLRDGDVLRSPFQVDFAVRGMGVIPAGKPDPKAGHHHVLIDTPLPIDPAQRIPFNDLHRHFGKGQTGTTLSLPPGPHTLRLLFADHEHRPYFVFSPELHLTVSGPRDGTALHISPARFEADCKAWYADERSRPRPPGERAVITNLRDGEPVASPFNLRFAVDGFSVAPRGRGGPGLGHFVLEVLKPDGKAVQTSDLVNGATQINLFLAPAAYQLRLRFVDDSGRHELTPAAEITVNVVAQERY